MIPITGETDCRVLNFLILIFDVFCVMLIIKTRSENRHVKISGLESLLNVLRSLSSKLEPKRPFKNMKMPIQGYLVVCIKTLGLTTFRYQIPKYLYSISYHLKDRQVFLPPEVLLIRRSHSSNSVVGVHHHVNERVNHSVKSSQSTYKKNQLRIS